MSRTGKIQPLKLITPKIPILTDTTTQYSPSVVTSLFPNSEVAQAAVQPGSDLLGIAARSPTITGTATAAPASAVSPYLDATLGPDMPQQSDLATQILNAQNLAMGITPAPTADAVQQAQPTGMGAMAGVGAQLGLITPTPIGLAAAAPTGQAAYTGTQAYGQELQSNLMRQELALMQQQVARNYLSSQFGDQIRQDLGNSMSYQDLQNLIRSQLALGNQTYNAASPTAVLYGNTGANNLNINALSDAQKRKLMLPTTANLQQEAEATAIA